MLMDKPQICTDTRPCFARQGGKCRILNKTYDVDGQCPFCKRQRDDKLRKEENTLVVQED